MNHFLTGTLSAFLITGLLAGPAAIAEAATGAANAADAAKIVNSFAFRAAGELAKSNAEGEVQDFFLSPYSIMSALGMTWAGAVGETKTDMALALGLGDAGDDFHKNLGALSGHLTSIMDGEDRLPLLAVANRIWIAKDLVTKAAFANILKHDYDAAASRVNFEEPDVAKWQINSWVEQQTYGRIRDLIQEILPDTRMVLTNAVYFKGAWATPFPESNTEQEPFYSSSARDDTSATVPMMKQIEELNYAELDNIKILRLPYAGGADMLIALPGDGASTSDIIDALAADGALLDKWFASLTDYSVNVWLPRFKMETSYELKNILSALGMERAFGRFADFSAMAEDEETPLHIDSVIHKTFLDVNERETEAAAATGVVMMRTTSVRLPLPRAEFHADHPFVFFILDRETNAILFMGRKSF